MTHKTNKKNNDNKTRKLNKKAVWGQMEKIFGFLLFLVIITAVYVAVKNNWLGLEDQIDSKYLTMDWDKDGLPNSADKCACGALKMDDHPDGGRKTCVADFHTKEKCFDNGREKYFKWYEDKTTGKKMCYYENRINGCMDWLKYEYYPSLEKKIEDAETES